MTTTSLDYLGEISAAVCMVRGILYDLRKSESGDRNLDEVEHRGIQALLSLIAGEREAQHDRDREHLLAEFNKEDYDKVFNKGLAYHEERKAALKRNNIEL